MKPENVKCPECDGPMVSRKSKYGVFWGCRKFPECKGTRDSMGRSKVEREAERDADDEKDFDRAQGRVSFKKQ
jgi:ssDNA-binding Zn-finger/Zn-ribbon topoisomerase 1